MSKQSEESVVVEENVTVSVETESFTDGVILVSKLDHPCEISYAGDAFMLSPRGKTPVIRKALLGAVPKNVIIIPCQ